MLFRQKSEQCCFLSTGPIVSRVQNFKTKTPHKTKITIKRSLSKYSQPKAIVNSPRKFQMSHRQGSPVTGLRTTADKFQSPFFPSSRIAPQKQMRNQSLKKSLSSTSKNYGSHSTAITEPKLIKTNESKPNFSFCKQNAQQPNALKSPNKPLQFTKTFRLKTVVSVVDSINSVDSRSELDLSQSQVRYRFSQKGQFTFKKLL